MDKLFKEVRQVVSQTLGIEVRAESLTPTTQLMDSLPEFDSMAVLNVILAIEKHFGVTIEDEEVTGDLFETLGTLTAFVEQKVRSRGEDRLE